MRLRLRFSPLVSRVSSVDGVFSAALRVASRRSSMPHRDALAVEAEHQQVAGVLRSAHAIARRSRRSPAPHGPPTPRPAASATRAPVSFADQLDDLVERRPSRFLGDDPPHLVASTSRRAAPSRRRVEPALRLPVPGTGLRSNSISPNFVSTFRDPRRIFSCSTPSAACTVTRRSCAERDRSALASSRATSRAPGASSNRSTSCSGACIAAVD